MTEGRARQKKERNNNPRRDHNEKALASGVPQRPFNKKQSGGGFLRRRGEKKNLDSAAAPSRRARRLGLRPRRRSARAAGLPPVLLLVWLSRRTPQKTPVCVRPCALALQFGGRAKAVKQRRRRRRRALGADVLCCACCALPAPSLRCTSTPSHIATLDRRSIGVCDSQTLIEAFARSSCHHNRISAC